MQKFIVLFFILFGWHSVTYKLSAQDSLKKGRPLVYQINVREEISPGIARQFSRALSEADAAKADRILIRMNTYGGLLDAADSIRTLLLNSSVPTLVFIDNNAASAGALIAIACNRIYMRKGANIGAATVVNMNAEALPDKYQSYMRSMMRSTAEARGRDPKIAEAMVDERIYIEGINDSGKVLTLTAAEAFKLGYCDGIAETTDEILKAENITDYDIKTFEPTWVDRAIGFLILPGVSGVLILIMLGGIYYELQQPGIGFPLVAGLIAAVLYFAPLYLEGLAANWEIIISVIGIALIIVELFVIPGFGIAGISGIILLIGGLVMSLLSNDGLDFSGVTAVRGFEAITIVVLSMSGSLILFIAGSKYFATSPAFNKMVLQGSLQKSEGYVVSPQHEVKAGDKGITVTMLRPSGKVEINGIAYPSTCETGYIEKGVEVEVIKVLHGMPVVKISGTKQ